jgi:2-keto-4-pentenoate hydratase
MKINEFLKALRLSALFATILSFLLLPMAWAAEDGAKLANQFLKKIPLAALDPNLTLEQAVKVQEDFVKALIPSFGEAVGYKAGLTNPAVQKVFGVTHPVRGTLLKNMILKSGSEVPADFGAAPVYEGDFILRVGSERINEAGTPEEALKSIDTAIPFIELPDLAFAKGVKINGPALVAMNVGARFGIAGDPIPVKDSKEWMDRLKNFKLQILDEKGTVLAEGQGSALMEHPLNAVLWIRDSLKAEGKKLKKGDLLSLGSLSKLTPPAPNTVVRAKFIDLDPRGPVEISVRFK